MQFEYINEIKCSMNKHDVKQRIYRSVFLYLALAFVKRFSCARLRICIIIYIIVISIDTSIYNCAILILIKRYTS